MAALQASPETSVSRVALGITAPLGVLILAYALWGYSDRVGYVGPLDKAAFGWAVVVPVWLLAPMAAGWAWRDLSSRATAAARLIVGAILTIVAAVLLWIATTEPGCDIGPRTAAIGWVAPSLITGLVLGTGLVVGGSLARRELRGGHRSAALMLGVAAQAGFAVIAVGVLTWALIVQGGCERPSGL